MATPIPGTGRKATGHMFRRPRNIGIKRALIAVFGGLRGVKAPPDSYDDIGLATRNNRSWKRHRKTQHKPFEPFVPPKSPEFCRVCGIRNDSDDAMGCSMRNPGCSDGR